MSATQFVETLKEIGYPLAADLDGPSLEWMLDQQMQPFFDWFCNSISQRDVLSDAEIEEYAQLESSGEQILDGAQLEEAVRNMGSIEDEEASEEKLRAEVARLTEEVEIHKEEKTLLLHQRNKLHQHCRGLSDKVTQLKSLEKEAKRELRQGMEQSQSCNKEMNSSIEHLREAVVELCGVYGQAASGPNTPAFLSQLTFDDYFNTEEKFTKELTAFTKKQFFEGIAVVAGQGESSRFEFIEISDPDSLLLRGEKEEVRSQQSKELSRLQAILPKRMSQQLNATIEECTTKAALQYAGERLQHLKQQCYPQDIKQLSAQLQKLEDSQSGLRRDYALLSKEKLPALIREAATLQFTGVLQGDYNLKIARQDYFISNQDQVIEQLLKQRARNEFLTVGLELEAKDHRSTHHLLKAVSQQLSQHLQAFSDRIKMMGDTNLTPARHQRSTVDSRDQSTINLYQLLDEQLDHSHQLFYTHTGLEEAAERLGQQVKSLRTALSSSSSQQDNKLSMLEANVKNCEAMVYAGSSTVAGFPVLSPQPIVDTITQLEAMLNKLEQTILETLRDLENKKKTLKRDQLLSEERKLFVYFHNNPSKLEKAIEVTQNKLQSLQIK